LKNQQTKQTILKKFILKNNMQNSFIESLDWDKPIEKRLKIITKPIFSFRKTNAE
jgi:hypothetical protein